MLCTHHLTAADWPQWGRTPSRNMVSPETGLPSTFNPGKIDRDTEVVDIASTKNIKWVAKLGSQSYGNPTIADGKVFISSTLINGKFYLRLAVLHFRTHLSHIDYLLGLLKELTLESHQN